MQLSLEFKLICRFNVIMYRDNVAECEARGVETALWYSRKSQDHFHIDLQDYFSRSKKFETLDKQRIAVIYDGILIARRPF